MTSMSPRWARCGRFAWVLPLALGCGGEEEGGMDGGDLPAMPAAAIGYAPCPAASEIGEFVVELAPDYTRVGGKVFDGALPSQVPVELMTAGACRLLTPPALSCDPPCAFSTQTCGPDGMCLPLPMGRDVGTVTVDGMAVPVSMTPNAVTKNYSAAPALPHPGFEPGASLRLRTTGGDYEPLELHGWGVSLFTLSTDPVRVDPGAPTLLEWETPDDPGPAHVFISLNINVHGAGKAWIECDFPDSGAGEIPAELIDGLIAEGLSGFPTLTATRRTATSSLLEPGCVELLVSSQVEPPVTVNGLTSCNDNSMCPAGQTCRPLERFCE